MDGKSEYDVSSLNMKQLEALQEEIEDQKEEDMEDAQDMTAEMQELYGAPEPEQKHNQHSFLHKAVFDAEDTVRTTFLKQEELGRPLFTLRFMLDMEDVCKYYLDPILKSIKLDPYSTNGIANYFKAKIQNVTHSGMSNGGFAMMMNVTQKKDLTRVKKRENSNTENLKRGKT